MRQVMYCSLATGSLNDRNLLALLRKSRINNKRNHITGVLVFFNNQFIQCIEGEDSAIEQLISNIKSDGRNTDFTILIDRHTDQRNFPDWSMGYLRYQEKELAEEHPFFDIKSGQDLSFIAEQHKQMHNYLTSLYKSPY